MSISYNPRANGWESRILGDCLSLLRNGLSKQQNKDGRGLPVTRIETIASGRIDPQRVGFVEGLSDSDVARYRLQYGDILFSHINSEPQIGRTVVYEGVPSLLLHGMNLLLLRPTPGVESFFLHFLLSHLRYNGTMLALAGRAVGQSSINQGRLESLQICIPELEEQRQIAAVLSAVQRAIERQKRLIALSAELRKALMHKLFTEGTRGEPLKQTEIGPVPQSWEPTPLGTCCDIVSSSMSYADFGCAAESTDDDAVPCMALKVSDMNLPGNEATFVTANTTKHLPAAIAKRKLVPPNAVVFPKRGAAIATNKKRLTTTWTALDPNLIAVRAKDVVHSQFLFYWLQTFDLRMITDPGPTPQLNKKDVAPVKLPLPPTLEEQRLVSEVLDAANAKWVLQRRTLAGLGELFRTLLHQLMTTQIRIRDLDLSALEEAEHEPVGAL